MKSQFKEGPKAKEKLEDTIRALFRVPKLAVTEKIK
jgi:hypothetical protein